MKKCPLDKRIKCDKMDCKTCEYSKDFNALFSKKKKTYTREELLETLEKLEDMEGI
jgi:hypothetical protein